MGVSRIELLNLPFKPLKLNTSVLVVDFQGVLAHNTRLLLQLLELLRLLLSISLQRSQLRLNLLQLLIQTTEFLFTQFVLGHDVLVLLPGVRQDNHGGRDLFLELVEFLIAFLDLFVQSLVLNFQLFKVDQVKPIR